MIIEFVEFKHPAGWSRERILEDAKHTIPKWSANSDLVRKHFLIGLGTDAGAGGGISAEPDGKAHELETV